MRSIAVLAILSTLCVSSGLAAIASPAPHHRHAERNARLRLFRKSTFSRGAVARSAAGAAVAHARNHPHEWGHGAGGYARRFASGFGQHVVKGTIQMGVGAWRHEDPRSNKPLKPHGFFPKLKDAARNTFTVRRYGHKKRSVAAGRMSGAMGAGLISRAWQPASLATVGAGLQSGGISIGADLAVNTAREFIPSRKHHHGDSHYKHHRRAAHR